MDKVAVFADVQNMYYTVKQRYHCHFDYGAFLEHATSGRSIVKAIAYATDKGDRKQIDFQQILRRIGFEIKLTPFLQRRDGSAKGDWDVGIALDMVEYAQSSRLARQASQHPNRESYSCANPKPTVFDYRLPCFP